MTNERIVEIWSMLALQCSPLLSNTSIKQILTYYGNATNSIQALNESTTAWSMLGISNSQVYSFTSNAWKEKARYLWEKIQKYSSMNILLSSDKEYPPLLREISDPPHILYYQGSIEILSQYGIAVIGTRKASAQGKSFASSISKNLVEYGFSIISGLAEGIDTTAHLTALEAQGATIAVLGNGLDIIYPSKNAKLYAQIANNGCLLTEFPPTTPPKAVHFPVRNRVVSGLSLGVLVVEAGIQSGTMITVKNALEQGRSVYAIPSYYLTQASTGNSHLLEEGALSITTAEEIFEDLVPQLLHGEKTPLLTKKILEYQQKLSIPKKDYFTDMLHIFEQSTLKTPSPSRKQTIKNFPNPIPSPFIYNPIASPKLYYREIQQSNVSGHAPPRIEFSINNMPIPSSYKEYLPHDISIINKQRDKKNDTYTNYLFDEESSLFTPLLEKLFQDEESITISTQTTRTQENDSFILDIQEQNSPLTYQNPLKETINNTVAYGISNTGETILDILHKRNATPEDIVQLTSLNINTITTELILLEVQGLIQKQPGGYYSIAYE